MMKQTYVCIPHLGHMFNGLSSYICINNKLLVHASKKFLVGVKPRSYLMTYRVLLAIITSQKTKQSILILLNFSFRT